MPYDRKTNCLTAAALRRALERERIWLKSEELPSFKEYYIDIGYLKKLDNNSNHLVSGRRGTGKTHLLGAFHEYINSEKRNEISLMISALDVSKSQSPNNQDNQSAKDSSLLVAQDLFAQFFKKFFDQFLQRVHELMNDGRAVDANRINNYLEELLSEIEVGSFFHLGDADFQSGSEILVTADDNWNQTNFSSGVASVITTNGGKRSKRPATERRRGAIDYQHVRMLVEKLLEAAKIDVLHILIDEWMELDKNTPSRIQNYFGQFLKKTFFNSNRISVVIASIWNQTSLYERTDMEVSAGIQLGHDINHTVDLDTSPVREPAQTSLDDTILPFEVAALDSRGRIVRLGAAVDAILTSHDYPLPVAKLLGEAIVLTVMLGSALKFEGRFILQTQSDGPVHMLVVDFISPDKVRACARFDAAGVAAAIADKAAEVGQLLGRGHLAMTIDQGPDMNRYQGLVPLEGGGLEQVAHEYFLRSEQIPTRVRLAVAEDFRAAENGARRHWRAGGILLQFLPKSAERARQPDLDPGDAPPGVEPHILPEDEAWVEGRSLIATVDDLELIDPALSSERLAYRLFHEHGVRVFRAAPVRAQCSCSRHSVENMLRSFPQSDRDDMVENGKITVTCEFCSSTYVFAPEEIATADAGPGLN